MSCLFQPEDDMAVRRARRSTDRRRVSKVIIHSFSCEMLMERRFII